MVYVFTQCLGGSLQLYPHIASKFAKLATLKIVHATSGLVLFLGVTVSLMLGMNSTWFQNEVTGTSWYACMFCPLMLLSMVATQVVNAYLTKASPPASKPVMTRQKKTRK